MDKMQGVVRRYRADLAAVLVVAIWGSSFVFQKAAFKEFDPLAFTFLRFMGMLAIGWSVVAVRSARQGAVRLAAADQPRVALAGLLGFSCYILLSTIGLRYTTAFSNALLIAIAPLFMALLLWALRLERIGAGQCLAMAVAFGGVLVFVLAKAGAGLDSAGMGNLISLAGAFFFAAFSVANKPLIARYPVSVLTTWTLTAGAGPVLLICTPALIGQDWSRVTVAGWAAVAWATIFPVYLAWTVWAWVNGRLGVARASVFMYLVPVIGGITSWAVLNEGFGPQRLAGALLVFAGLVLSRRRQAPLPARTLAPSSSTP